MIAERIDNSASAVQITACLISHTNAGKTSLIRTLLRRDVGEVRDEPHVTLQVEAHVWLTDTEGDSLVLLDSPGLGDSVRLTARLAGLPDAIGWLIGQTWDRWRDPVFFLSQQALRAARERADLVLYVVNALEHPDEAGYLSPELKLLEWLGHPVIAVLNQTGPDSSDVSDRHLSAWNRRLSESRAVRAVTTLDAFCRSHLHEHALLETLEGLVPDSHQSAMRRLRLQWESQARTRLDQGAKLLARLFVDLARMSFAADTEQQARDALSKAVSAARRQYASDLLLLHGLEGYGEHPLIGLAADSVDARLPVNRVRAGLLGALTSGLASGAAADLAAGGLTLGAGAVLGAALGAVSFTLAAAGINQARNSRQPSVTLTDTMLLQLIEDAVVRALAVAHFGRARGRFDEPEVIARWRAAASVGVGAHQSDLMQVAARIQQSDQLSDAASDQCAAVLIRCWRSLYPAAELDWIRAAG